MVVYKLGHEYFEDCDVVNLYLLVLLQEKIHKKAITLKTNFGKK